MTQYLIDNQQMQIYSLKSQLTKANELIDLLNEEALSRIGVITHLETKLGKAEELIGKLRETINSLETLQYTTPNMREAAYNKAVLDCTNRMLRALKEDGNDSL